MKVWKKGDKILEICKAWNKQIMVSRIYKELLQINDKNNPIEK